MSEVMDGRCMVCRAAWEPCKFCKRKLVAAQRAQTMAANGTTHHVPSPPSVRRSPKPDVTPASKEYRQPSGVEPRVPACRLCTVKTRHESGYCSRHRPGA
jgi:hypothetical protein